MNTQPSKPSKFIIPNPFNMSPYGHDDGQAFNKIINVSGANPNAEAFLPSNMITKSCQILPPVQWQESKEDMNNPFNHIPLAVSMQENTVSILSSSDYEFEKDELFVIGGDHTISIGTGAYLSSVTDMSKIGLLWIDAHSDFNTEETSDSKSLTGYPCAINTGLGKKEFLNSYNSNFVSKVVQIGLRDVDELEAKNLEKKSVKTYNIFDIEEKGLPRIIKETFEHFSDCDYIWLSLDIDSLDPYYCDSGRTDVPVIGGLTPRELMYITQKVKETGKLKVTELVQINNVPNNSNLIYLGNRIVEVAFGLGDFRYNK
ncbi:MAG: arginase family protein [Patescibacteria group bacterium]